LKSFWRGKYILIRLGKFKKVAVDHVHNPT
jgi:hypothetical protein